MQIVEKKLKDIIPYEKNPRKNDNAVDAVASSISQFGFKVPVVIDKDGVIVCGHTRYKAAKKLGLEKVPCVVADDLIGL
jgi:ParB-like chromosome segregation protein Spo0J